MKLHQVTDHYFKGWVDKCPRCGGERLDTIDVSHCLTVGDGIVTPIRKVSVTLPVHRCRNCMDKCGDYYWYSGEVADLIRSAVNEADEARAVKKQDDESESDSKLTDSQVDAITALDNILAKTAEQRKLLCQLRNRVAVAIACGRNTKEIKGHAFTFPTPREYESWPREVKKKIPRSLVVGTGRLSCDTLGKMAANLVILSGGKSETLKYPVLLVE